MTGLLWFDDDPGRSLREKVAAAARRYGEKFGKRYPADWEAIAQSVKARAGGRCERCGSPSAPGRILTVHHLDGDPGNNDDRNLAALCQRCHLSVQAKYRPGQLQLPGLEEDWLRRRRDLTESPDDELTEEEEQ